jgi:hypothetical protein
LECAVDHDYGFRYGCYATGIGQLFYLARWAGSTASTVHSLLEVSGVSCGYWAPADGYGNQGGIFFGININPTFNTLNFTNCSVDYTGSALMQNETGGTYSCIFLTILKNTHGSNIIRNSRNGSPKVELSNLFNNSANYRILLPRVKE